MFELGISTIVFIAVLIIGIILLKNVFKIIVFIVSAALVFMLVGGALLFLDVQAFSNNFFSQQNQILLLEPTEDKIISSLVIDFDNESNEGSLLLQTDEMIMRADKFYSTNSLSEQPDFYKHIIFKTTSMPEEYEFYGVELTIEELVEVMKANDPIVELKSLLSEKIGEERADEVISLILREINRENKLRSYLFMGMISEMPEEFTVSYLMDNIADKNISIVPETPVFALARHFPKVVDWASQKIEKQFEI